MTILLTATYLTLYTPNEGMLELHHNDGGPPLRCVRVMWWH